MFAVGVALSAIAALMVVDARSIVQSSDDPKIFYYNQYGADDQPIRDCDFGAAHSHMFIAQVQANHCQLVKVPQVAEEKYVYITYNATTNQVTKFRDLCDATCTNCNEEKLPPFSPCFENLEGSSAIYEEYCAGSSNVVTNEGLTAYYYTTLDCSVNTGNLHDVQYIRNYPKQNTNGCVQDHTSGDNHYFYSLQLTEDGGDVRITAKMSCSDNACTNCEYTFTELNENACAVGSVHSVQLKETSSIQKCGSDAPPGPPPATTVPHTTPIPGPPGENWGCFANRCAITHQGYYYNESDCIIAGICGKPSPPPTVPGSGSRYGCFANRCVENPSGAYDNEAACLASNECAAPPPPPGPPEAMYNCSGYPDYMCTVAEFNGEWTNWDCIHQCVPPADHFACIDQRCTAVDLSGPGVAKELCEQICRPNMFQKDVVGLASPDEEENGMSYEVVAEG